MPTRPLCLLLAVLLDLTFGEPPAPLHPVVWLGKVIACFRRSAPRRGWLLPLLAGVFFMTAGVAVCVAAGLLFQWSSTRWLSDPAAILVEALLLKMTFSVRMLSASAGQVAAVLAAGNLAQARQLAHWHLVSRDTAELDEARVAAAAIESVAENASDSVVAPLLFYAVAGLPGALAYRFVNTADAMIGYRDPQHFWLGKTAARLDDLLNLIPARLTAVLMILGGAFMGSNPVRSVTVWRRDCRRTSSPNAGQPMSAAAGVLGVELEKVGHYRLGEGQRLPDAHDITRARRLLYITTALALAALAPLAVVLGTL